MIRDNVAFSLDTYLVLLEDNNLGEPPTTLGGGELWYPDEERATRRERAYAELDRVGVLRGGRVDPSFLDTVNVMQRPAIEHYTFATIDGRRITARTAASGRDAVLVVSDGETIDVYPGEPEQLPEQLFWSLPEHPAASVHAMSCQHDDYQAALEGKPVSGNQSGRDAKQAARWIQLPRVRGGQLFTAANDGVTGRRRSGMPPRWFDTEQGRIFVYFDSTGFLNVVPGTIDKVTTRLRQMEKEVRGR